ncbi:SDR family oxidoreductase [Rhizobium sp. KVB221]|uniref:SDR family oxidoreductase n=1 Tax=Rhizobium setariae TaxID=2801340 RepID=A0A937CPW4_9HYPH|nr:SDR family oxidoreductase [Rhizobium setariae]MBL0373058.1 SDR family oxidoreductase [Rhizobium setariae]
MSQKLLVTGASGHLGRLVLDDLLARGVAAGDIIATTREVSKLADYAAKGIDVRKADYNDPASLQVAFKSADRLVLISTDALDDKGTRIKQHRDAVAAAKTAGVKHIIYTSLPNVETSKVIFAADHRLTEEAIEATGLGYTFLRNTWYQENLLRNLPQVLATGQWYTSAADGRIAHVARADCAAAIGAVLASGVSEKATYTLTGSEARTTAEIAALVTEVTGRKIDVIQLTDEQLADGMKAAGVPGFLIPTLVSFEVAARAGDLSARTEDVEKLTGKRPTPLRAFLEANKSALLS